ncbi:uncharacterized protein [Procambarus clarkii]|uniref:uncharacterized protein n=1 Tax=Procambarus clarkii TaxID=6728 RepID=UPI001E67866B|nr:uncharacterized protein LOC123754301 [Procambarus clarkii]
MEVLRIPLDWKYTNVASIKRENGKSSSENNRPFSLTSHIPKLMKGIARHHSMNDLVKSTHGFVKNISCLNKPAHIFETGNQLNSDRVALDVLYLDFSFDMAPHLRLAMKLQARGINGRIREWIKSVLKTKSKRSC